MPLWRRFGNGLLPESVIDQTLRRLFTTRFRLGMFDPRDQVPYSKITPTDNDTAAHRQLALRMAQESIVLLKNENGLLPLKQEPKTIAVVGPNATNLDALVGNYNGTPSQPVNVLDGIRKRFSKAKVTYVEGVRACRPCDARPFRRMLFVRTSPARSTASRRSISPTRRSTDRPR